MGITFRSGDYIKFVRFGHRTVKDGEAVAIWNARGELTQVIGPRRVTLWFSTIRFLYHFQATVGQFLQVKHRNGTTEHLVGPVELYLNPTKHTSITVMDGRNLINQDDCLILYSHGSSSSPACVGVSNSNNKKVGSEIPPSDDLKLGKGSEMANRKIVYGPQFVIPSENEWIHTFDWSDINSSTAEGSLQGRSNRKRFQILKTNQTELSKVRLAIRTQEGPVVNVLLCMSYKIEHVEKCLDMVDPMACIYSALVADANRGDLSLVEVSKRVSQVSSFASFQEAVDLCGFRILKLYIQEISMPRAVTDKKRQETMEHDARQQVLEKLAHDKEMTRLEFEKKQAEAEAQARLDKIKSRLASEVKEENRNVEMESVQSQVLLEKL